MALAALKKAAEFNPRFAELYHQRQLAESSPLRPSSKPRPSLVWLAAVGTALLFFSFAALKKTGFTSISRRMVRLDELAHQSVPRPDAMPGGFQLVRTLGTGGMGVVYEARDLALERTVAIKKLRDEVADNPRERQRFLKEARMVAALHHPNIVEIHSVHEDGGLFLVFERVDGETLHERLGRSPLTPEETVAISRQVALALDYAHLKGIVHQDLKPANIMLDKNNNSKVMDFGIARRVAETLSTMSKLEISGTPAYMAPEQEAGQLARPATDIYALGCCVYEMLCGRPPFPVSGGGMMMKAQKLYRPLSEQVPGLNPQVDAVIGRALEPEPSARWPNATSFVSALARALASAHT